MDWHVFEAAGKYAGLSGIAVIVLLYVFQQILKLGIFTNVGSRGTVLLINNIINKVFWATIVALLAWLAVSLSGKSEASQGAPAAENISTIYGQNIKPADLPAELLNPIQKDSADKVSEQLKQRSSLTLSGSTLTLGAPGEGRTVTIACNTLRLSNGAKIITNGNNLVLLSLNARFGENAGIVSFSGDMIKAPLATDGFSGGKVRIKALEDVSGGLRVFLPGQNGGDGTAGAPGPVGAPGNRGANAVDGAGCKSGGQDGAQGGQGGKGGQGQQGGKGGDGGELVLEAMLAKNSGAIDFDAPAGLGGKGGPGGPGGAGGPGGQGGSGSTFCGGGHGGAQGLQGQPGDSGPNGADGKAGSKSTK